MDSRSTLSMIFKLATAIALVYTVSALPEDTVLPEEDFFDAHPQDVHSIQHYNDESNTRTAPAPTHGTDNYPSAARNIEFVDDETQLFENVSPIEFTKVPEIVVIDNDDETTKHTSKGLPEQDLLKTNVKTPHHNKDRMLMVPSKSKKGVARNTAQAHSTKALHDQDMLIRTPEKTSKDARKIHSAKAFLQNPIQLRDNLLTTQLSGGKKAAQAHSRSAKALQALDTQKTVFAELMQTRSGANHTHLCRCAREAERTLDLVTAYSHTMTQDLIFKYKTGRKNCDARFFNYHEYQVAYLAVHHAYESFKSVLEEMNKFLNTLNGFGTRSILELVIMKQVLQCQQCMTARQLREAVEAERKRVEAMPEGPEKQRALAALAIMEAECEAKEAQVEALHEYMEKRTEFASDTAGLVAAAMTDPSKVTPALPSTCPLTGILFQLNNCEQDCSYMKLIMKKYTQKADDLQKNKFLVKLNALKSAAKTLSTRQGEFLNIASSFEKDQQKCFCTLADDYEKWKTKTENLMSANTKTVHEAAQTVCAVHNMKQPCVISNQQQENRAAFCTNRLEFSSATTATIVQPFCDPFPAGPATHLQPPLYNPSCELTSPWLESVLKRHPPISTTIGKLKTNGLECVLNLKPYPNELPMNGGDYDIKHFFNSDCWPNELGTPFDTASPPAPIGPVTTPDACKQVKKCPHNSEPELKCKQVKKNMKVGSTVVLKGGKDNKYCCDAADATVKCNRGEISDWEKFKVFDAGDGKIALMGGNHHGGNQGNYCAVEGTSVKCNSVATNAQHVWKEAEKFTVYDAGVGKIALKGGNSEYCAVDEGNALKCNKFSFETLTVECVKDCDDSLWRIAKKADEIKAKATAMELAQDASTAI